MKRKKTVSMVRIGQLLKYFRAIFKIYSIALTSSDKTPRDQNHGDVPTTKRAQGLSFTAKKIGKSPTTCCNI
jgi:hypothetical protein